MSPAPRIRAERPASRLKILPARATAAEGAEAAPIPSPVSLRTRAPTSSADWNRRCSTGPACPFEISHASRTCPWICDSPSSIESSPERSEEHTSELQSRLHLVCRLLLEKKKKTH